jgi:hypothetical protein
LKRIRWIAVDKENVNSRTVREQEVVLQNMDVSLIVLSDQRWWADVLLLRSISTGG